VGVLNASGAELVRYDYEPYGYPRKTTYASGISALDRRAVDRNPIRWKGYYLDQSTGFYYLQSRYYSPYAARFLTADDPAYLGANGDFTSYNLFTYCGNNPIIRVDPTGRSFTLILVLGIVGVGLGFGATAYADYKDDGEVFNGSVEAESYVVNSLFGGLFGAGVGHIAPFIKPFLSTSFTVATYATAGGGVASATLTIGQALGVTLLGFAGLYFASQDRPGDNKKQNRQFRDAMKQLKITDKDQMRRVHDKIKGKRFGYNELIDFIRDILGLGESFQWIENYSIE